MLHLKGSAKRVARWELWIVGPIVGISMAVPTTLPVAVGALAVFMIIRSVAYGRVSVRTGADPAVVALCLTIPITLAVTPLPDVTFTQIYRLLSGVGIYYAIVNWATSPQRITVLMLWAIACGGMLALIAPFIVLWSDIEKFAFISPTIYAYFPLLVSDPINRNVMAGTLVMLIPIVLALVLFDLPQLRWLGRGLAGMAGTLMGITLLLTQSRGAFLALLGAFLCMALLRWKRGWIILAGLAALLGIMLQQIGAFTMLDLLFTERTFGGGAQRLEAWSRGLYMIRDFPFTGIGMGAYLPVVDTLYPFVLAQSDVPHAHNLLIQIAVDLGIPGLLAWLSILMVVVIAAYNIYRYGRTRKDGFAQAIGIGALGGQVALIIHGLTDAVTWGMVGTAPIVWMLWGVTMAAYRVYCHQGERHPTPMAV